MTGACALSSRMIPHRRTITGFSIHGSNNMKGHTQWNRRQHYHNGYSHACARIRIVSSSIVSEPYDQGRCHHSKVIGRIAYNMDQDPQHP
ncbi:hypothetical protein CBS147343_4458 [Aspergillus niger]|nr:hypothetical protein CBS11350_1249 [Aspergillus niger]KAI2858146.1 hypothetical protein CBS11232_2795 [Aspergillus niger]KAI2858824.1 hypothetical protein CBS12448_6023 [Aspergillus niger]KAI2883171.1 hypothetical protein CBS13152_8615 [Aspergillus niger]KAI2913238.1 hypothetical protein CBS147371_7082 [Aspergillus niger]